MARAMQQHRLALIGAKALAKVGPQVGVTVGGPSSDGDGHGAIVSACHNPNDGWGTNIGGPSHVGRASSPVGG